MKLFRSATEAVELPALSLRAAEATFVDPKTGCPPMVSMILRVACLPQKLVRFRLRTLNWPNG
jgi:hypothetical protein